MKKILLTFLALISLTTNAHSFMTYGEFKELILSDETSASYYIRGITMGNLSYSRYMNVDKPNNEQLYCPPNNLELTIKHSIEIIETEANRIKVETKENVNNASIPLLYIWGMQNKYPCEN